MRSLVSRAALSLILPVALATISHAQQPAAACDAAHVQQIKEQMKALSGAPTIADSQVCTARGKPAPGVLNYSFLAADGSQLTAVIFEVQGSQVVMLGAIRQKKCSQPAKDCAVGWLNNAFLQTGYGDIKGAWTTIQEDDPALTIQKTLETSQQGFTKR
jgi:hypothetical protein